MRIRLLILFILFASLAGAQSAGITAVTVSSSATPTLTTNSGYTVFLWTLSTNVTSSTFSSAAVGAGALYLCQDGTGGRTVVFPTNFVGFQQILNAAASACQAYTWYYDGTNVVATWPLGPGWIKTTIPYTTASTGALTNNVTAFSLPANICVMGIRVKEQTAFTGNAGTLTVSLGRSGTETEYLPAFSLKQTVSATNIQSDGGCYAPTTAAHTVVAKFTSSSGNLSSLTAGSVDLWILVSVLP